MKEWILLKSRGLLGLKAPNLFDAIDFLQGVCTQNVRNLADTPLLYGLHLTPQGRLLDDFFISQHDNMLLLECAASRLMALAKSLHTYEVGNKVEFHDLSADFNVYASVKEQEDSDSKTHTQAILNAKDPRHPSMGQRFLRPAQEKIPHAPEEQYHAHRIALGIPEGPEDREHGRTIPAEMGYEHLNAINYTKGCYVGQELTARMHYRTEPKKKIFIATFETKAPPPGTPILREQAQAGTVLSGHKHQAIIQLRTRFLEKKGPLTAHGKPFKSTQPDWWPPTTQNIAVSHEM